MFTPAAVNESLFKPSLWHYPEKQFFFLFPLRAVGRDSFSCSSLQSSGAEDTLISPPTTRLWMKGHDSTSTNCRQNSNLLITYLFFTFVRGVWRGKRQSPTWLTLKKKQKKKQAFVWNPPQSLSEARRSLHKNCIRQSFPEFTRLFFPTHPRHTAQKSRP